MSKPFTKEQNLWLQENFNSFRNYRDLTEAFNKKFNTQHRYVRDGYSPVERRCRKMGLKRFSTNYGFTKEEDDWLKKYAHRFSNKWLAENISSVCGKTHSEEAIKMHIREWLGICKGNGGIREDTIQTYKKPIGSICWSGCRSRIKIQDTGDDKKDWYSYGRYVYEQHYNIKLPREFSVIHLDGNGLNFNIENLCPVTQREHAVLTANGWHSSGQITKTGVMWARLSLLMGEN